ncbi:C4-dicarboxylate transporter DctA, partial [Methylobacterium frigidaeris]
MPRFLRSLFGQVVAALILGVMVGIVWPDFAVALKPLGDGFIKLIKMAIAPLVFGVVVHGIVGAGDLRKVGRVGLKALIYFEAVTTMALVLGLALAYVVRPGEGMGIDPATLDAKAIAGYTANVDQVTNTTGFLLKLIPTTIFDAFARGDILQVLIIAVLFGAGLSLLGESGRPLAASIDRVTAVLFKVIGLIVRLAPLGVLGAVAFTVGRYGAGSLLQLGKLVAVFYVGVALFVVVVLGGILRLAGFSLFKLLAYLREELLVVAGTASSDSVLPQVMRKLEALGIRDSTVGLVIPTGYSFNLDAFSLYLTLATVFIAQATGTALSIHDLALILGISLL